MQNHAAKQLTLFVIGASPNSIRAISNLLAICEHHLPSNYRVKIIDVYQHPQAAVEHELLALPYLLKDEENVTNGLVGTLCDTKKVLAYLNIF